MNSTYDILIIGAGVVGSAITRELSKYKLKIGVLEKNLDVCNEQSGRNSAVIHGGFAYDEGSKKAKFCIEGCLGFEELAKELDIPYKKTGKVLVGNTKEDYQTLLNTIEAGKKNGSIGLRMINEKELKKLVPAVTGKFAMLSPLSSIIDPFLYNIALAENACENGADFHFDNEVTGIEKIEDENLYVVHTSTNIFKSKWIINAAGNNCTKISDMLGITGYEIGGTKGDYIILDQKVGPLLPMPVYPVPSTTYMGIHVTPTIDGNVTVGPNANSSTDYSNYGISKDAMDYLAEDASNLWPHIHRKDYIRNYSGIQPTWKDKNGVIKDYVIEARKDIPNTVNLVGIESPGLTSAVPIAKYVVGLIKEIETLVTNDAFNPNRTGIVKFSEKTPAEQAELIKENPDYGEIICRCETVTKAEILEAIHNPLGVDTITGIKYRTRALMGRCQGGYCQMRITKLIQEEKNKKVEEVIYSRQSSQMFTGKVRI